MSCNSRRRRPILGRVRPQWRYSNAEEQQIRFAARFRNNLTEMRLCLSYIRLIERMRYDASLLASLR
jgi:hypothetical protein